MIPNALLWLSGVNKESFLKQQISNENVFLGIWVEYFLPLIFYILLDFHKNWRRKINPVQSHKNMLTRDFYLNTEALRNFSRMCCKCCLIIEFSGFFEYFLLCLSFTVWFLCFSFSKAVCCPRCTHCHFGILEFPSNLCSD